MTDKTPSKTPSSKTPVSDRAERIASAGRVCQVERLRLVSVCTAHQIAQSNFTQDNKWEARDEFISRLLNGLEDVIDDYVKRNQLALEKYEDAQRD